MSKYSEIAPSTQQDLLAHFGKTYNHIKPASTVLDVGSSTGYYGSLLIQAKGCTVDGIEIDAEDRKAAQKVLRKVYDVNLDAEQWPTELTKSRYDTIFLGDVLEHVISATTVLARLSALLKPGGNIIISTPNIAHISIRLELLAGNFEYERTGILDETHLKYFTLRSLTEILRQSGLSIVAVDYSLADLMPDLVAHWLKKLGLQANQKFWNMIRKPEARAYQYKLVAVKASASSEAPTPPNKPLEDRYWYLGQIDDLNKIHKRESAQNTKLKAQVAELERTNRDLSMQIEVLSQPLGRKVERKFRSAARKIKDSVRRRA